MGNCAGLPGAVRSSLTVTVKPVRMRGAALDITKRKQAELEAARHRNEMAHLSRVTTLGELSGSIAHELSLPLSAILSNAQAAQRILANGGADLAEVREILNDIVSEDKHASEVIRRLRLWLKKGEVEQHSLRINKVVEDVLKLIRSDLINQNVTVDTELGTEFADSSPATRCSFSKFCSTWWSMLVMRWLIATLRNALVLIRTGIESGQRGDCIGHGSGPQDSRGKDGTNFRAFLYHEREGNGPGPFGLPYHHCRASRKTLGRKQCSTAARRSTSALPNRHSQTGEGIVIPDNGKGS